MVVVEGPLCDSPMYQVTLAVLALSHIPASLTDGQDPDLFNEQSVISTDSSLQAWAGKAIGENGTGQSAHTCSRSYSVSCWRTRPGMWCGVLVPGLSFL